MGRFIHTADTHLGYQQYHRPERKADYQAAFTQIIDAAIEQAVDAVIHSGDFFHDSRPSTDTIRDAIDQLRRLKNHDIRFLAVVGNHESTQNHQWLDIFAELGLAVHLDRTPCVIGETAFYGLDYVPESKRHQVTYDFRPVDTRYAVLVAHGLFNPISPFGTWDIDHVLGSSDTRFNAVLLGDDHTPRIDQRDETIITYAGSTERTAIDQHDDRVYNLVRTDPGESGVRVDQVELSTRPHDFIQIELPPGSGEQYVRDELDRRDLDEAVVAVSITGEGEDITPASIEEYGKQLGAFIVRVSDQRKLNPEDIDLDVSFANPDDAVRTRIREMGLSVAAYEIEQMVRDISTYRKSNLPELVERDVQERLITGIDDFEQSAEIAEVDRSRDGLFAFVDEPADEVTPNTQVSAPNTESTDRVVMTNPGTDTDSGSDASQKPESGSPDQASFDDYHTEE